MEDYIDIRCPFCRCHLTDVDGMWECQGNTGELQGCGASTDIETGEWYTN
jgi:hypothetical protein